MIDLRGTIIQEITAVRTIAQTAIATIGTTALIQNVDWLLVLSASGLAGVLSILTSIVTGLPEAPDDRLPKDFSEED